MSHTKHRAEFDFKRDQAKYEEAIDALQWWQLMQPYEPARQLTSNDAAGDLNQGESNEQ